MLWKIFRGHRSAWFPLLFACCFVEFDTTVIYLCLHDVFVILFRLISVARYAFKSPRTCFRGTKYEIYREHVAFEFYIATLGTAVIRTVCEHSRLKCSCLHASLLTVLRVIYAIVRLNSCNFASLLHSERFHIREILNKTTLQNLSKYWESAKSCVPDALAKLTSLGFRQTDMLLTWQGVDINCQNKPIRGYTGSCSRLYLNVGF